MFDIRTKSDTEVFRDVGTEKWQGTSSQTTLDTCTKNATAFNSIPSNLTCSAPSKTSRFTTSRRVGFGEQTVHEVDLDAEYTPARLKKGKSTLRPCRKTQTESGLTLRKFTTMLGAACAVGAMLYLSTSRDDASAVADATNSFLPDVSISAPESSYVPSTFYESYLESTGVPSLYHLSDIVSLADSDWARADLTGMSETAWG